MRDDLILCERLDVSRRLLRVAIVTETYPPEVNGVATTVARFVEGLRALDHEIQLVRPRQRHETRTDDDVEKLLMRGLSLPNYPAVRMGLPARAFLTREWTLRRPDVVHVVTEGPLGWSAVQAASRLKIALTSDFRTNFDSYSEYYGMGWLKKPIGTYLRKLHNRTLVTTAPTASLRRRLLQAGYRNVEVVARGVDTALFNPAHRSEALRAQWRARPEDPVVGCVGRLAPEKNLPLLLSAFRELRSRHSNARLVLVGDGPARATLAGEANVVLAGTQVGEALAAHYASFDFFFFPSETETFGNVTIEAMASGLALVAYDYAAAAEHIEDGVSGLLARYGDGGHFTQQALRLVADPELAAGCRAEARKAAEKIGWAQVVKRLEAILFSAADMPAVAHRALQFAMKTHWDIA